MKFKVAKIIYDYDIQSDDVRAIEHYVECDDDDPNGCIMADDDVEYIRRTVRYKSQEWNDLLYWIRSQGLPIDVVKAIDEVSG